MKKFKLRGLLPNGYFDYGIPTHNLNDSPASYDTYSFRLSWHTSCGKGESNALIKNGTLGEFTGKKDLTGRDIYQGDILEWVDNEGCMMSHGTVEWNGEGVPKVGEWFIDIEYNEDKSVECVALTKHHIVYKTSDEIKDVEYLGCILSECRVIPNPAETAKKKAIDEIVSEVFTINKRFRQEEIAKFIYDNYKKYKVKPLSYEKYIEIISRTNSNKLDYKTLIENGYCIGEDE